MLLKKYDYIEIIGVVKIENNIIKKIKEIKLFNKLKFLIIVIAISIFACQPYLNNSMIYTHDLGYHLNRINEICRGLILKQTPVLIHSGLLNNLGYANSLFYPELFLYLPAILMYSLGVELLNSYRIFLVVITFFTFLSMYISSKEIFKKKGIAWISSILYTFSLYRLTDIYIRGALGEILSFIFVPLIFYGLYEIIFGDNKKWWIIAIGLFGIANSHVLTFVMILPIIILFCIINIDKIFKDKKRLINLILSAIVAVLLCIGFFGPMLEQKANDTFYIDNKNIESAEIIKERATSFSEALETNLKSGYDVDTGEKTGRMSMGIGITLLLFASLTFIRKDFSYKENRFELQIFVLAILTYIMTTKFFPWEKLQALSIIQFPFRINIIPTVCLSFLGASSFYDVIQNKRDGIIIATIILLIFAGHTLGDVKVNFNPSVRKELNDIVKESNGQSNIGTGEYLPEGTNLDDTDLYNINNPETLILYEQHGSKIGFLYGRDDIDMQINIPLLYYKGYRATIEDDNGNKHELEVVKNEKNGHVLLKGDKNLNGKILVEYKMTIIQKVCYTISVLTMIILLGYIIVDDKLKK